ncbi:partial (1-_4)-alpha-D-glucan 1-alpha-D-glucosylmutase, partial [uncultured bacterium]
TGLKSPCSALFYEKKKLITEMDMMSDVTNLAQLLKMTLSSDRYGSDITMQGLKKAIVEVMAEFSVYRTYIRSEGDPGVRHVKDAVYRAIGKNPALLNELTFLEKVLTLNYREYQSKEEKGEWLRFVMRFQQFTGPLMAKGVEDTLLYVYNRLLSLNEVGSSPAVFTTPLEDFHSRMSTAAALRPGSMNATATHDTKRGEDARARINVISELSGEWERQVKKWSALNRKRNGSGKNGALPDKNDEYYFYQALLGSFPFSTDEVPSFRERMRQHMIKAVREAKIHTAWLRPDREYEERFMEFIDGCLDETGPNPFLESFLPFQRKVAWFGMMNSLSQTLLKITCPGVPDLYQGTELWDLSMVDPDNRRPVDFGKRRALLEEIVKRAKKDRDGLMAELLASPQDGRVKLFATQAALQARRARQALFASGQYLPLECLGEHSRSAVAFARASEGESAVTIVPRFLTTLCREGEYATGRKWGDTLVKLPEELHGNGWTDAFTGRKYPAGKELLLSGALATFPIALLLSAKRG